MEGGRAGDIRRYSFLHVFANDPTIDASELEFMKRLALEDGVVDDEERRVLSSILGRVSQATVDPDCWIEIRRFKAQYGID